MDYFTSQDFPSTLLSKFKYATARQENAFENAINCFSKEN